MGFVWMALLRLFAGAVVWEGVIMYLEEDAVASNFRTVAEG